MSDLDVRVSRDEVGDYDVFIDGVQAGTVRKGGLHSMTYYPWTVGKVNFGTRREGIAYIVRRYRKTMGEPE